MAHRNYHEVAGETAIDCAVQLGRKFGKIVRSYVDEEREATDWRARQLLAEKYAAATRTHFPDYSNELEAYAEAARIPLMDLWAMMASEEIDAAERCTTVVANGGKMVMHNEDWDADAIEDICVVKKTCNGFTSLELYYYGTPLGGTALTLCSRGYVQAINSLSHTDRQIGVPKAVIARRLSALSNTDRELSEALTIPRASGFCHNLVSRHGDVTSVECTARHHAIQRPPLPFVHTNHILSMDLNRFEGDPDVKSTFKRFDAARALARSQMSKREVIALVDDQRSGKVASIFNRNTIARAIVDFDERQVAIWLAREPDREWINYSIDFMFDDSPLAV